MKITKLTDKYDFYQEDNYYVLNLGKIKKGENTTTTLLFEDVNNLKVTATCGCTATNRKELGDNKVEYTVSYNSCDSSFSKTLNCSNNEDKFLIKIKGQCQ